MTRYSLVIPVYKNEETIPDLVLALQQLNLVLDRSLEVVFVVDGSPDRSYEAIAAVAPHQEFPAEIIRLSRNFGSFAAIRSGLAAAQGPFYAVMAADLQEPPELVVEFYKCLESGESDVVFGVRQERNDPFAARILANVYWALYRRILPDIPPGGVDVFGCSQPVRDAVLSMEEATGTLIGLLFWMGFRRSFVPYSRRPRAAGQSAWSFRRKVRYMSDSAFAFTDLPITLLALAGAMGLGVSLVASLVVFVAWVTGRVPVLGYTPIMLMLSMATCLILLSIGIVGGYIVRTFENTKRRPMYLVASRESYRKEPRP